jgi:hypothetical protein
MANKKRGELTIDVGGRTRKMKLTLNDFAELQDKHDGKPLMDILSTLDKMDVKVLRSMLYLALRHDDPDLTEEQVGNFDLELSDVALKLGNCISLSLGGDKPTGKK